MSEEPPRPIAAYVAGSIKKYWHVVARLEIA